MVGEEFKKKTHIGFWANNIVAPPDVLHWSITLELHRDIFRSKIYLFRIEFWSIHTSPTCLLSIYLGLCALWAFKVRILHIITIFCALLCTPPAPDSSD